MSSQVGESWTINRTLRDGDLTFEINACRKKKEGRVGINTYITFDLKGCFVSTRFQSLLGVSLDFFFFH